MSGVFSLLRLKPHVAFMSRKGTERDSEQGWLEQPAAETPNKISGSKHAGFCYMIPLMPKVGISDWISQRAMDFTFCRTEWYFQLSQYELLLRCTSPCSLSTVQQNCTAGRRWGCRKWYPSFSFLDYLLLGQRGEKQHLTLFFFILFFQIQKIKTMLKKRLQISFIILAELLHSCSPPPSAKTSFWGRR